VKETRIEQLIANPPSSGVVFGAKLEVERNGTDIFDKMLFEFEKNILK